MTKAERKWRAERERERRAMGLFPSDDISINLSRLETYKEWEQTNSAYFIWDNYRETLSKNFRPKKKKLIRRNFINEARNLWFEREASYMWDFYLTWAMLWMTSYFDNSLKPSTESIGAVKVFKIAQRLKEFADEKKESGETKYTFKEVYESLKDIMEA